MAGPLALIWDLIARDQASAEFLRVAGAADKAATASQAATAKMNTAAASMSKLGGTLTKSVTVPLLGIAAVSVDQAAKFQKSMTLLQTAGGETADKMTAISAGIKKTAIDTGTSLAQLNEGMYIVAKFGSRFSATDQLLILKAAAEGAKAENVDLGTSVNALTTVMQSYGAKASDAISIQNQLVVAAGKSKTTMTDFSQSLSNVIPLASSLGISFAQVGGAIATMTQHGESAQQATDNLNNLIRNLAGQNNVASQAMQQLGINTLDLRKNLAQNGLTGTLQTVENALARSSKSGLIVVSAFKQAALATQSLNTMLSSMTGDLKNQSEGLLKGSESIKDYRTYARSLGGEAGAAALQFLALYQSSQGFSNALKSGNSTVSTAAAQLQKMLGGATGLNVALMLGGNSAKSFTDNVAAIGAAAGKSGTDIATWAKTQDTLAVKTDQARERLQVMAVDIGDKLMPVAEALVKDVKGVVDWFTNLSAGTQGVILKVALFGAALGPVLSITGRLLRTTTAIIRWGQGFAAALTGTAAASARAAAAESSALADKAVNTAAWARLEAEKAEATAVAARAIAASLAATDSVLAADSAAAAENATAFSAAMREKAAAAEASAIKIRAGSAAGGIGAGAAGAGVAEAGAVTGGAAVAAIALPVAALAVGGYELNKFLNSAADAAGHAMKSFGNALKTLNGQIKDVNGALTMNTALTIANNLQSDGMAKKAEAAGISLTQLTQGITGTEAQFTALGKTWKANGKPSDETLFALYEMRTQYLAAGEAAKKSAADQSAAAKTAAQVAADSAAKVKAAAQDTYLAAHPAFAAFQADMQSVNRSTGDVQGSLQAFRVALGQLGLSGKTAQTGLASTGTAAGDVSDRFKRAAQNAIGLAAAMNADGASNDQVARSLENNVMALEAQAEKLGLNKSQVDALIESMNLTPSEIDTYFNVDIAAALANIATLKAELASLGAQINGAGATDAESRAQGTKVAGQLGAAQARLAGSLANLGKNVSSRTSSSGGQGPIGGTPAGGGGGGGSGNSAASALKTALDSFTTAINNNSSTSDQLKTAVQSLIDAAKTAGKSASVLARVSSDQSTLLKDAAKRDAINARLGTNNSNGPQTAYDILNAAKDAFKQEASTVAQAIKAGFNIQSAGADPYLTNGAGTESYFDANLSGADRTLLSLQDATRQAAAFQQNLKKIAPQLGSSAAGKELLQQLAEGGYTQSGSEAAALAAATPAQLKALVAEQQKLDAIAQSTAASTAKTEYQGQIDAANKIVVQLQNETKVMSAAIAKIGADVAHSLNSTATSSSVRGSSLPAGHR